MTKHEQQPEPAGVRTSPTGRVPKWAMDEALGRPVDAVPFRGPVSTPTRKGGSVGRLRRAGIFLVVGAVIGALFYFANPTTPGAPFTAATTAAGPERGHEEALSRLAAAPPAPAETEGTRFRFLSHREGTKQPVTWSPCRPIHYVTRPDNAPQGGSDLIAAAVAEVSAATGLRFVDDGATTEGPSEDRAAYQPSRYGRRWAPVLIARATAAEVPDFGIDVDGEAGPARMSTASGDTTYVSGALYLDPAKLGSLTTARRRDLARTVVLHELGHLVGLAHVNDRMQLMYPRAARVGGYGPGDLAGLAALGRGPCQPDI